MNEERTVIGVLDHSIGNNSATGIVKVLYEKIDDMYHPINKKIHFCDTQTVFITSGYDELESKYTNKIFELIARPSNQAHEEGKAKYVSIEHQVSNISSNFICAELIESKPPEANKPIISSDFIPITTTVFTRWDGYICGPFSVTKVKKSNAGDPVEIEVETKTIEVKSTDRSVVLPSYHYFALENQYSESAQVKFGPRTFISNIRDLLMVAKHEEFVDFISDEKIISSFGSIIASSSQIRNFTKNHIRLIKEQVKNLREYRHNKARFERLFELFDEPQLWTEERKNILDEFFQSEKGINAVEQYINDNKDTLLADKLESIEREALQQQNEVLGDIDNLLKQKVDIEDTIRSKNKELQSIQDEDGVALKAYTGEEKAKLDLELKSRHEELVSKTNELDKLEAKYNKYKTLDEIEQRTEDLLSHNRVTRDNLEKLENQRDRIIKQIEDKNNELLEELVKLKPQVDMLSGIMPTEKRPPIDFAAPINYKPESFTIDEQQRVLENISDQLMANGRKLDFEELANVVISLVQNQFTLFSGLPGTGKTSLGKLLGKSIGLNNRLLNIPVARGWTSQRDVIGFYNTLSQSYVPSASGLYDLLAEVQNNSDGDENTTAIVLLDEFNLSQPEHYFSPFMEMADPESNRIIHTGDPKKSQLYVPEYIRFLGTINNDESVQELTPRMLDRCAIIHFEDQISSSNIISDIQEDISTGGQILSGNDFIKLFNNSQHTLQSDIAAHIDEITNILHDDAPEYGSQVIVSFRKLKAITNYYNVASPLMISNKLTALDFAVNQHIIPLIRGYGANFGTRLCKLEENLPTGMEKSKRSLRRIISKGENNLDTYGAFL